MLSISVLIASLSVVLTLEHIDELVIGIHPEGNSQTKSIGSNVVLRCTANTESPANTEGRNQRNPVIRWRGPDTDYITASAGRVHVESTEVTSSALFINFLDSVDAGFYSCEVEFDGQYRSREIQLIVFEGITFANTSTYVEQKLGTDALLECSAFAESRPELSWRFAGQRIEIDGVKYAPAKGGSLRVKNVQLADNGTYECRAELDSYGELAVRNVLLNVLHGPMFVERPQVDDVVVKGSRIELRCVANGNPTVKYEWIKEQKVTDSTKLKVTLPSTTENSYVIESVDVADEGRYICRVSNKFGSREASVDISMLVRPQLKHMPPERRTVEGGAVIVSCEATAGLPEPTVQWYRIGAGNNESEKQLTDGAQPADEDVLVDRTHAASCRLIISNIRRSHAGSYTCMARNEIGVHNRTIEIIVEYQPTIADGSSEATFDVKQYGWPGQVRQFTCSASGLPIPTITWMRNSQPVASNEFYRITMAARDEGKANGLTTVTSTLQITIAMKQTWLYGSYTCIAKNNHGNPKKVFSLLEAVRPDAPSDIAVVNETPTSVTISVGMTSSNTSTVTNGDNTSPPITSWLVEYQMQLIANESEEETKSIVVDNDGSRILTVSDLEPDQLYAVYISSVNQVGYSDKTKILVRTPRQHSTVNGLSDQPLDREDPVVGQVDALEITPAAAVDGNNQTAIYTGVIIGVMATLAVTIAVTVGAIIRRRQRHFTTSDGWCKGGVVVCCEAEHRCQKDDSDKMQHAPAAAVVIRRNGFRLSRLMFWKRRSNLSQTSAHANGWPVSGDAEQIAADAVNVEAVTVDLRPSEMTQSSAAAGADVKEFTPTAVAEALQNAGSCNNIKSAHVNSPHLSECRRAPSTPPRTVFRSPSSTPGSPRLQRPGQLDSQAWKCLLPSSRTGSNSNTPTAAMPSSVLHQSLAVTSSNPFPERDWQLKKFLESPMQQRQSFCSDDERAYHDILDGYHSEDNIEE